VGHGVRDQPAPGVTAIFGSTGYYLQLKAKETLRTGSGAGWARDCHANKDGRYGAF